MAADTQEIQRDKFLLAIRENNVQTIKDMLSTGFNPCYDKAGITPLYLAVQKKNIDIVKLILEAYQSIHKKDRAETLTGGAKLEKEGKKLEERMKQESSDKTEDEEKEKEEKIQKEDTGRKGFENAALQDILNRHILEAPKTSSSLSSKPRSTWYNPKKRDQAAEGVSLLLSLQAATSSSSTSGLAPQMPMPFWGAPLPIPSPSPTPIPFTGISLPTLPLVSLTGLLSIPTSAAVIISPPPPPPPGFPPPFPFSTMPPPPPHPLPEATSSEPYTENPFSSPPSPPPPMSLDEASNTTLNAMQDLYAGINPPSLPPPPPPAPLPLTSHAMIPPPPTPLPLVSHAMVIPPPPTPLSAISHSISPPPPVPLPLMGGHSIGAEMETPEMQTFLWEALRRNVSAPGTAASSSLAPSTSVAASSVATSSVAISTAATATVSSSLISSSSAVGGVASIPHSAPSVAPPFLLPPSAISLLLSPPPPPPPLPSAPAFASISPLITFGETPPPPRPLPSHTGSSGSGGGARSAIRSMPPPPPTPLPASSSSGGSIELGRDSDHLSLPLQQRYPEIYSQKSSSKDFSAFEIALRDENEAMVQLLLTYVTPRLEHLSIVPTPKMFKLLFLHLSEEESVKILLEVWTKSLGPQKRGIVPYQINKSPVKSIKLLLEYIQLLDTATRSTTETTRSKALAIKSVLSKHLWDFLSAARRSLYYLAGNLPPRKDQDWKSFNELLLGLGIPAFSDEIILQEDYFTILQTLVNKFPPRNPDSPELSELLFMPSIMVAEAVLDKYTRPLALEKEELRDNMGENETSARNMHIENAERHYRTKVVPYFKERGVLEKLGKIDAERIKNGAIEIRKLFLEQMEENAVFDLKCGTEKLEQHKESLKKLENQSEKNETVLKNIMALKKLLGELTTQLPLWEARIAFIRINKEALAKSEDRKLRAEALKLFCSNKDPAQIAWRAYDPDAPVASKWPNLFVTPTREGEYTYINDVSRRALGTDGNGKSLEPTIDNFRKDIQMRALHYFLIAVDPVGKEDDIRNRKMLFTTGIAEVRRGHNTLASPQAGDDPSCYPGVISRLASTNITHPFLKETPYITVKEHFLNRMAKIIVNHFCTILKDTRTSDSHKEDLYTALVGLNDLVAEKMISDPKEMCGTHKWMDNGENLSCTIYSPALLTLRKTFVALIEKQRSLIQKEINEHMIQVINRFLKEDEFNTYFEYAIANPGGTYVSSTLYEQFNIYQQEKELNDRKEAEEKGFKEGKDHKEKAEAEIKAFKEKHPNPYETQLKTIGSRWATLGSSQALTILSRYHNYNAIANLLGIIVPERDYENLVEFIKNLCVELVSNREKSSEERWTTAMAAIPDSDPLKWMVTETLARELRTVVDAAFVTAVNENKPSAKRSEPEPSESSGTGLQGVIVMQKKKSKTT